MTTLNYDANGFILGVDRMSKGIDNVHDDTQEIIAIFKSQNQISNTRMRELTRAVKAVSYRTASQDSNDISRTRSSSPDRRPRISSASNQANADRTNPSNRASISRSSSNAADRARANNSNSPAQGGNSDSSNRSSSTRQRDANGRFISESSSSGFRSSGSNGFGGVGSLGNTNIGGVDPLLDSLNEAKDLLSPLGRGIKLAGRGAKFSWSKIKAMKRREPLSNDETRHNNENEKLLDKIWKAIKKNGGGNGGGLGGGLLGFGGIGKKLKKGLKFLGNAKILGPLAALAGTAGLAMDWDTLDHKGKSEGVGRLAGAGGGAMAGAAAGAAVGSIVPIVGTAVGGLVGMAVGGWLGSEGGEALGAAASPYIEDWTRAITAYNLPKKMGDTWDDGIKPFFNRMDMLAGRLNDWLEGQFNRVFGDPTENYNNDVSAGVTVKANKAADLITKNALTRSSGYCAKFVREGLQQAGYDLKTMGDAKNYNNGALTDAGFSKIDSGSAPQKGDVMVMPAQGGHGAGHMQMYNGQQWVSDFKQNSKNPWNDVATENLQYTMYRDQRGAMVPGTSRGGGTANQTTGMREKSNQAMKYFTSQGWTKEQAAGIVGNLQKESKFDHTATGDGGKAKGVAQWHPDRQAAFKAKFGKNISNSSYAEQLAFVQHELTQGSEKGAGQRLKKARTAAQAGAVVSEFYERPANTEAEKRERAQIAEAISKNYGIATSPTPAPKSGNGILGFSVPDVKPTVAKVSKPLANTPLASNSGYAPANLPATPVLKIPKMQAQQQRLDSGSSNPVIMQASNDTINQNVSDRGLAHAITGGIGQDRYWG